MDGNAKSPVRFAGKLLPWLITIATLILYVVTLNHWVSLTSVLTVAKVTGWDWWSIDVQAPVHFLVTYPVRWLPAGLQIGALNFFTALCAAATLGLLARSVALLPQDHTREQRQREHQDHALLSLGANWLPPVFAVLVCGLQLTFWENATAHTGEMLNLLLFAYVIRCLLEYRLEARESWLLKSALVYGLAATNNWAMIGFFPLYLGALIWLKRASFWNRRFLLRMAGLGLAGLSLYLILPLVQLARGHLDLSFLQLLRLELGQQKYFLVQIPKWIPLLLSLTTILPLVILSIRWPSTFGDVNPASAALTNLMFRVVHGLFLGFCAWVAFDPPFSPRHLGLGLPFLTFYYLGALCAGYYLGYFLLVFGKNPEKSWQLPSLPWRVLNGLILALVWLGAFAVPATLIYRNLPIIRDTNSTTLKDYTDRMARCLPTKNAVVMSDNPYVLLLLSAWQHGQGQINPYALVDARSLPSPAYQKNLAQRYPTHWHDFVSGQPVADQINSTAIAQIIGIIAQTNDIYYLHPVFGRHYLENHYLVPHGLVYRFQPYPVDSVTPPPLPAEEIAFNQKFWGETAPAFGPLHRPVKAGVSDPATVAGYYSLSLNYWGVEQQKAGHLKEARQAFEQALNLNPNNTVARENLNANALLANHESFEKNANRSLEDAFGKYRTWHLVMSENGPFDEPQLCFLLGETFTQLGLLRQAATQFTRARELNPANLEYELYLADVFNRGQVPDKCLALLADLRQRLKPSDAGAKLEFELDRLWAMTLVQKKEFAKAQSAALETVKKYPKENLPRETLTHVYILTGDFTNAMASVEEHLKLFPNNISALLNKGAFHLQKGENEKALAALEQVLKLSPDHPKALQNHASANLNLNRLDAAASDYEAMLKAMPQAPLPYLALGEIAYRQKRTQDAISHYEAFLKLVPASSKEAVGANQRLKELKGN